ncbi:hypothetical protein ACWGJ9_09520 [Curtobacterium citreum]
MTGAFIAPTELTALIGEALRDGDEEMATRYLPEAINRILTDPDELPDSLYEAPAKSTGEQRWDTLIATAFAWAFRQRGLEVPAWMTDVPPLHPAWLLDGDLAASDAWRAYIREQTPSDFLDKGILLRERDLRTA